MREREAWLRSCEVHWRLMDEWLDNFPDFKRFHEFACAAAYSTLKFDRDRFARAYEEHERGVREYFRERPGDLLVMDICAGDGWEKLCPFLGLPAPPAPFPHANEWMHLLLEASADVARTIPEVETFSSYDRASGPTSRGAGGATLTDAGDIWCGAARRVGPPSRVRDALERGASYSLRGLILVA